MDHLEVPTELKNVQKLAGCVAALSLLISRLGEKAQPLYRMLKQTKTSKWTEEAIAALEDIKALLATNPILAAPGICESMILYTRPQTRWSAQYSWSNKIWRVKSSRSKILFTMSSKS